VRAFDPKTGHPFFQKRRRRYDETGHARELTFSCYRHFPFLGRDRTRKWFVESLEAARRKWGFELWAYCLMPEHAHLLVHANQKGLDFDRIVGTLKQEVARKAIAHLEEHSPGWLARITVREHNCIRRRFWQPGGGYDRNVVEIATVHTMVDYIHANPVRRKLVDLPEDWEWSSARWYAGIQPVRIEMDTTLPMLHPDGQ